MSDIRKSVVPKTARSRPQNRISVTGKNLSDLYALLPPGLQAEADKFEQNVVSDDGNRYINGFNLASMPLTAAGVIAYIDKMEATLASTLNGVCEVHERVQLVHSNIKRCERALKELRNKERLTRHSRAKMNEIKDDLTKLQHEMLVEIHPSFLSVWSDHSNTQNIGNYLMNWLSCVHVVGVDEQATVDKIDAVDDRFNVWPKLSETKELFSESRELASWLLHDVA